MYVFVSRSEHSRSLVVITTSNRTSEPSSASGPRRLSELIDCCRSWSPSAPSAGSYACLAIVEPAHVVSDDRSHSSYDVDEPTTSACSSPTMNCPCLPVFPHPIASLNFNPKLSLHLCSLLLVRDQSPRSGVVCGGVAQACDVAWQWTARRARGCDEGSPALCSRQSGALSSGAGNWGGCVSNVPSDTGGHHVCDTTRNDDRCRDAVYERCVAGIASGFHRRACDTTRLVENNAYGGVLWSIANGPVVPEPVGCLQPNFGTILHHTVLDVQAWVRWVLVLLLVNWTAKLRQLGWIAGATGPGDAGAVATE
ncbi:hypothetical protein B0H14DRAFT_3137684 [Mycena olivaceomarginata]|nr:hypothetical protein B0H14DRAFT_3137684 [Mycena olivaceomarginata]